MSSDIEAKSDDAEDPTLLLALPLPALAQTPRGVALVDFRLITPLLVCFFTP